MVRGWQGEHTLSIMLPAAGCNSAACQKERDGLRLMSILQRTKQWDGKENYNFLGFTVQGQEESRLVFLPRGASLAGGEFLNCELSLRSSSLPSF